MSKILFFPEKKNEYWLNRFVRVIYHLVAGLAVAIWLFKSLLEVLVKPLIEYTFFDLLLVPMFLVAILVWVYFAFGGFE